MKPLYILIFVMLPALLYSQASVNWLQDTRGVSVAVDNSNNVYTVDYDYNPAGDIYLTKRDLNGNFNWVRSFDQTENSKWEKATWVTTDNSGNIIVTGDLMSGYSNPVNAAGIIMKFDPSGNLLWRNVFENSFDGSYTKKCIVDIDNNIYVLGAGPSVSFGFTTKVTKFSSAGSVVWTYYNDSGIGVPVNFKFTPDNKIVIASRSVFGSINGYARLDLNGNPLWSVSGIASLTAGDAAGDSGGNSYLVFADNNSNDGTVVRKVNPSGNTVWENVFSFAGLRVEVGNDNLPVVSGYPNRGTFGSSFVKLNSNGGIVWQNPDADSTFALLLHAQMKIDQYNNIYLAAGTLTQMAVCKVNSNGTSGWTVTMPGSYANGIDISNDNNVYVVGGYTAKITQTFSGINSGYNTVPAGFELHQNFPNPFNPSTDISFSLPFNSDVNVTVYDVSGKEVSSFINGNFEKGNYSFTFNGSDLASGVYFYRLAASGPDGSFSDVKKMNLLK